MSSLCCLSQLAIPQARISPMHRNRRWLDRHGVLGLPIRSLRAVVASPNDRLQRGGSPRSRRASCRTDIRTRIRPQLALWAISLSLGHLGARKTSWDRHKNPRHNISGEESSRASRLCGMPQAASRSGSYPLLLTSNNTSASRARSEAIQSM